MPKHGMQRRLEIKMCVTCHMRDPNQFMFRAGRWRDTGPIIMIRLWRLGFSVGTKIVRPWLKPEFWSMRDGDAWQLGGGGIRKIQEPDVRSIAWGVFLITWRFS
jgi:hypothetical protein